MTQYLLTFVYSCEKDNGWIKEHGYLHAQLNSCDIIVSFLMEKSKPDFYISFSLTFNVSSHFYDKYVNIIYIIKQTMLDINFHSCCFEEMENSMSNCVHEYHNFIFTYD